MGNYVRAKCLDVIDGDTAWCAFELNGERALRRYKCRFEGFDAPEMNTDRAIAVLSRWHLASLIEGELVDLYLGGSGGYGRVQARVTVNGVDVRSAMILSGHAKSAPNNKGRWL